MRKACIIQDVAESRRNHLQATNVFVALGKRIARAERERGRESDRKKIERVGRKRDKEGGKGLRRKKVMNK